MLIAVINILNDGEGPEGVLNIQQHPQGAT